MNRHPAGQACLPNNGASLALYVCGLDTSEPANQYESRSLRIPQLNSKACQQEMTRGIHQLSLWRTKLAGERLLSSAFQAAASSYITLEAFLQLYCNCCLKFQQTWQRCTFSLSSRSSSQVSYALVKACRILRAALPTAASQPFQHADTCTMNSVLVQHLPLRPSPSTTTTAIVSSATSMPSTG
jgi:hypothetical protein